MVFPKFQPIFISLTKSHEDMSRISIFTSFFSAAESVADAAEPLSELLLSLPPQAVRQPKHIAAASLFVFILVFLSLRHIHLYCSGT